MQSDFTGLNLLVDRVLNDMVVSVDLNVHLSVHILHEIAHFLKELVT